MLAVLTAANVLNYLDRHIVSILGQAIKADLKLDDAQLGFLLGTAFAIFYSVMGVAMGGIADRLTRKKVMASGLALWSAMTALGGVATSFAMLSLARIGVGVGEAAAVPCAQSLVADSFPPRHRTLAMGTYVSAAFVGGALAMIVGGWFLESWPTACAALPPIVAGTGACGLAPWKAALIAVGAPGIPVALAVLMVREPARAAHAGSAAGTARVVLREIAVALPPFSIATVWRLGGAPALKRNLAMLAGIALVAALLVLATGDLAQWASLGFGVAALVTWGQIQAHADRPLFRLTLGDPSFLLVTGSTALNSCIFGSMVAWSAPFAMRHYPAIPHGELGIGLGLAHPIGSVIGVFAGSWLTDRWKARNPRASFLMGAASTAGRGAVFHPDAACRGLPPVPCQLFHDRPDGIAVVGRDRCDDPGPVDPAHPGFGGSLLLDDRAGDHVRHGTLLGRQGQCGHRQSDDRHALDPGACAAGAGDAAVRRAAAARRDVRRAPGACCGRGGARLKGVMCRG